MYNFAIMVAYKLDSRYKGRILDAQQWDNVIEEEIIRLVGEENANQVLNELAEYVSQTGGFAKRHLWGNIKEKPINWWNLLKA